jgi:LPS-assembly lipoprotein
MKTPTHLSVAVAAVALAGCGFHPLYGSGPTSGALQHTFAQIYVEPVYDLSVANTGYDLRNKVIDSLGATSGGAQYHLKMTLSSTSQGIALQNDASITRYNDTLTVTYSLVDATTGKEVTKGTETGLSAYNVVQSPYSTLVAQQDADRRVVEDISERIRLDLGVYFDRQRAGGR